MSRYSFQGSVKGALFILLLLAQVEVYAQPKANFGKQPKIKSGGGQKVKTYKAPKLGGSSDWKANRLEYIIGAGGSGFLGDLGGQDSPGKPFIYDLEPTTLRYSLNAGARYFIKEYQAIRGGVYYGRLNGSDATTNYPNRRFRNLNFKSPVIELSGQYEFHILKPSVLHLAGANSTNIFNGNRFGIYASAGAGLFFFNPKSKYQEGWHDLRPLHTEGQGLPGGPKQYKRIAIAIPMGGGVSYLLNRNYKIGVEFGYRWTTSDYIDDASGYYYDNEAISDAYGKLAGFFANPSVILGDVPNRDWYTEGQPRGGNKSNDTYMFLQATLSRSFTPSITNKQFKQGRGKKAKNAKANKKKFGRDKGKKAKHPKSGKALEKGEKGKKAKAAKSKKSFAKGEKGKKAKSYEKSSRIKNSKRKFKSPNLRFGKRKKKNKIRTF